MRIIFSAPAYILMNAGFLNSQHTNSDRGSLHPPESAEQNRGGSAQGGEPEPPPAQAPQHEFQAKTHKLLSNDAHQYPGC